MSSINTKYIIGLLQKNIIFIILFLILFLYNFYNVYNKIINQHPLNSISSEWGSNNSLAFEKLNLIGTSVRTDYRNYVVNINNLISTIKNNNDEILPLNSLIDNNIEFLKMFFSPGNQGMEEINFRGYNNSFEIFNNENVETFYYHQIMRKKDMLKDISVSTEIINEKLFRTSIPIRAKIILKSNVGYDYLNEFQKIDQFMNDNNNIFKQMRLDSLLVFFNWLKEELEDTAYIVTKTYDLDKSTLQRLNKIKLLSLENLKINKEKVILMFKQEDFNLFKKLSEDVRNLNDEINQKILTNLIGYFLTFVFVVAIFIFCREILSEYLKKNSNLKN